VPGPGDHGDGAVVLPEHGFDVYLGQETRLGGVAVDAHGKGSVEVTIPVGQPLGEAQIRALGASFESDRSPVELFAAVDIVACDEMPPSTAPGGGDGVGGGSDLPRTGSDSTMTLVRVGVALAALGGVLVAVSSKRRKRTTGPPT
jgi:LPXTG-motif cell wall-anchored protein